MAVRLQELIRKHKLTPTVLWRYEEAGLLTPRRNGERSWRSYSKDDVARVGFISTATAMGFTFPEIREFIASDPPSVPQDRIEAMVRRFMKRRDELSSRILKLRAYQDR